MINYMGLWFDNNKERFFKKYTDEELCKDIQDYLYGNGKLLKFLSHFFDECLYKCVGYKGRPLNKQHPEKTPYAALQSDSFIDFAFCYMKEHKDFFDSDDDISLLKSFFRNKRPRKVANFPVREAKRIIFTRFPDYDLFESPLNIHDASAGFGSRMSATLLNGCNYYATEVNSELKVQLDEAYSFLKKFGFTRGRQDVRLLGSECRVAEWKGLMDCSFTSPPYFNLEVYSDDDYSSTRNYSDYRKWKEEYIIPTCENINFYLKSGGYVIVNTKNLSEKEPIFDDFVEVLTDLKLKRMDDLQLNVNSKKWNKEDTFNEPVMIFKKL